MPLLTFHAPALRAVAESLLLPPLAQIARGAGIAAAYRITVLYHDGRARNSVATLTRAQAAYGDGALELAYARALDGKRLTHAIPRVRVEAWGAALVTCSFDRLPDQPNLPDRGIADVWLIERAAGTFIHSVIIAPTLVGALPPDAAARYATLVAAVRAHLPEALREIGI
jgi:hypothetical protein